MTLNERIVAFSKLGNFLGQFTTHSTVIDASIPKNPKIIEDFEKAIARAKHKNGWFTPVQIQFSLAQWSQALQEVNLKSWLSQYSISDIPRGKTVAVIMAGNIPLVGFHDFLCILLSGHKVLVKTSSNDSEFIQLIGTYLKFIAPEFESLIAYTEGRVTGQDAIIATGSNNTARYFECYFKDSPHLIRKNRNSVAVLTGDESNADLAALGEDIFRYYGMGCRSVSKLFVPPGYTFDRFFEAMFSFKDLIHENKYANNYDYNKAVYLMSEFKILDNGFLILKEDQSHASPIASVFYEFYGDYNQLRNQLVAQKDQLQCVVNYPAHPDHVNFGETQKPQLSDYADNIDTIEFLLKI